MATKFSAYILTLALLLTVSTAHALTPAYDSTFSPGSTTLNSGGYTTLSFTPTLGYFTNAILNLNITNLTNASITIGPRSLTSPPSAELFTSSGNYLITTDLKLGSNSINLTPYLSGLNLANNTSGINLGLYMDRGSVTLNNARLTGTVAPEPASMALVCAGLVALPFARRLRKTISKRT